MTMELAAHWQMRVDHSRWKVNKSFFVFSLYYFNVIQDSSTLDDTQLRAHVQNAALHILSLNQQNQSKSK